MFRTLCPFVRTTLSAAVLAGLLLAFNPSIHAEPRTELLETPRKQSKWTKIWKWSAAALVAGSTMDVASSYGFQEANGMLRSGNGQLAGRGTAIKFGVLGGALAAQWYLVKKNPELEKPLAITNFAVGAAYTGVAVRNWRVR